MTDMTYVPTSDGMGGLGLGGGLIGGLVLGALLRNGNGGLFGGNGDAALGGSAVNQLTLSQIQSTLGDIKGSIPYAEGQVQLALSQAQADINSNISTGLQTAVNGQAAINKNISDATSMFLQGEAQIREVVNANGFAAVQATNAAALNAERNSWAITQAISNDGDKTRALISQIDRDNLNRMLTTAQNEIIELRSDAARTADTHGITVSMINNQATNQLQFQQQQQQIANISGALAGVAQLAHATNQSLIIGNSGAVASGPQTANPVNVRA